MKKRVRLTEKNIKIQQETAPNGTLIHWVGGTCCNRKATGQDVQAITWGMSTVTSLAITGYYGNITCLQCRKEAWAKGIR